MIHNTKEYHRAVEVSDELLSKKYLKEDDSLLLKELLKSIVDYEGVYFYNRKSKK